MGQVVGEGLGCFRPAEALHPRSVKEVVDDARVILQQRGDFLHAPRNEGDPSSASRSVCPRIAASSFAACRSNEVAK